MCFFNFDFFIIVTLTTVGYGDISPKTFPGKLIMMFTALWGAVMISLVVVMVSKIFEMSENQEKALREIEVSRKAAKAVAYGFKFYKQKKQLYLLRGTLEPGFQSNFLSQVKSKN